MVENTTPAPNADKQIMLQRIYIKDCSFESPHSPEVFATPVTPEISVNMHTETRSLGNGGFEVLLSVTAEAKSGKQSIFLVEVKQAGLFVINGFSEQEQALILATYCPNILFPYLREMVSDLTLKGGMAPLLLQPVNFDALYAQQQMEMQSRPASGTVGH